MNSTAKNKICNKGTIRLVVYLFDNQFFALEYKKFEKIQYISEKNNTSNNINFY